jgi:predicted DNA-binding protein (MmcQ/YjbR family)
MPPSLDRLRKICLAFPDATEDIKWGQDLVFSVGGKMFCVVNTEPPHQMSFKCSPESFGELIERTGIRPAPYLARAMWVQEERLGEAFDRQEVEGLLQQAYDLVRARLTKRKSMKKKARPSSARASAARRSRGAPARARRRGR